MKLRISNNSLRIRLNRDDVAALNAGQELLQRLEIGPGNFSYRLRADAEANGITSRFVDGLLTILVPAAEARRLAVTDQVGIASQAESPSRVQVLIEKDFRCLDESANDPGEPLYPNPLEKEQLQR